MTSRARRSRGFTLIELLVVLAVLGALVSLLMPAVQQARSAARRTQCLGRLRELGLALHNYHSQHQILPAGSYVQGPSFPTRSGWGWEAMILPFTEQNALYSQIDFDIGTAVGSNRALIAESLAIARCPADVAPDAIFIEIPGSPSVKVATGNYVGVESVLYGMSRVRFGDVTDGLSQTLMLGERVYQPGVNDGAEFTSAWCGQIATRNTYVFNSLPHLATSAAHPINQSLSAPRCFTSRHSGGAQFTFADGHARLLSESMDTEALQALGTRDGGETIAF